MSFRLGTTLPVFSPTEIRSRTSSGKAARSGSRAPEEHLALQHPLDRPVEGPAVHAVADLALRHAQGLRGGDPVLQEDAERLAELEDGLGDDERADARELEEPGVALLARRPRSPASARAATSADGTAAMATKTP